MTETAKHSPSLVLLALFGLLAIGSMDTEDAIKNIQSQVPSYTIDRLRPEETIKVAFARVERGKKFLKLLDDSRILEL